MRGGFTLVEMAIVVAIIGLIIAGILVGQDLIHASEVRAGIAQYEKFNTAVNTFRNKHNGLPGDLEANTALGFNMVTRTGAAGHGDGNGLLEACSAGGKLAGCETVLIWNDLSVAGLVEGYYSVATDALAAVDGDEVHLYFPPAALGKGSYWTAYSANGFNYYQLGGIASTNVAGEYTLAYAVSPADTYNIDYKVDDGFPITGLVRGVGHEGVIVHSLGGTPSWSATPTTECLTGGASATDTAAVYNRSVSTSGNTPACHLTMRFN